MPLLNDLHNKYEALGFSVIGVNVEQETELARSFIASSPVDFPILLDTNSDVARLYYAQAMPFSVILNKDGYIVYSHLGYMRGDELKVRDKISQMVNQ